jgi:hypothetical protein
MPFPDSPDAATAAGGWVTSEQLAARAGLLGSTGDIN